MTDYLWWQKGIIYQIYPRSFQDSNADGVGDLPGITRRLDYVTSLGVDGIWLSPIYPSPMADFGYDVSDYVGIHPLFGTMAEFDQLLAETHRRGLKLILDLVPNHTSDQHPWFIASRSSRHNPRRDWYIWRDPAPGGGPPNNWVSHFGGPAWTFDERTGQYYLHQFLKEQPELNYRNPQVLEAMLGVMRYWLNKGIDGFRVDVIWLLAKDELFRDEPLNPNYRPGERDVVSHQHIYTEDLPEVHKYIRAMRQVLDEYDERMMVGEIYLPYERLMTYYGSNMDEVHLPFNFHLLDTPWTARDVRDLVERYEAALPKGGWGNWVLGNHDRARLASRIGREGARVAMMLLLTLRGTPTWYYGDEIGMKDVEIPPERMRDPAGLRQPESKGAGRDPERTPMQWNTSPNAGFCPPEVEPWLPLAPDYNLFNVAVEERDLRSMLTLFRRLTALRRQSPALSVGGYQSIDVNVDHVYAYSRQKGDTRLIVALNFGGEEREADLSSEGPQGRVLLSTELDRDGEESLAELKLRPYEGVIVRPAGG